MLLGQFPKKYVVWDLETSGLVPGENKILEIGALMVEDGKVVGEFNVLLNHQIDIPELITNLTGLTREKIEAEGVDPKKALRDFVAILDQFPASITHNGFRFDVPFLLASLRATGAVDEVDVWRLEKKFQETHCDTAVLYKAKKLDMVRGWNEPFTEFAKRVMEVMAKGVKYNVGVCCDELGIDRSGVVQHRAGGDIQLTRAIFEKLIS